MTDDTNDVLLVEEHGLVRLLTLNRPDALNATNEALHGALANVWADLAADTDMRALVITGAGRAFSGGGDLNLLDRMVHDTELRAAVMEEGAIIVRGMMSIAVPIIAAVNGPAVGLGCSLAGLSDIVLVEEQAYFSDPHVALGLVAGDGGAMTWPLLTSLLRAKEYILLGDRLPAEDAVRLGVANRVVPTGTAVEEALALGQRIAKLPPQSVRETKRLLNSAVQRAVQELLDDAVAVETQSFDEPAFQDNLTRMLNKTS
jgi:enoyl-CoA hydratase